MVTEEDTEGTQQSFTGCIGRSSRKGSSGKSVSVNPQEVLLFHHKRTELEFLLRIEGELCPLICFLERRSMEGEQGSRGSEVSVPKRAFSRR